MDERAVNDVAANAMNRPSVYVPALVDEITRLRAELYSCKEELREIAVAADDARVHNTMTLAEYVAALRAELAETTSALAEMVAQFFMEASDGALMHSFMSAEEHAISVLLRSGVAQEVARNRYRIDWNKIDSTLAKEG